MPKELYTKDILDGEFKVVSTKDYTVEDPY
jgi:hypothetical protein